MVWVLPNILIDLNYLILVAIFPIPATTTNCVCTMTNYWWLPDDNFHQSLFWDHLVFWKTCSILMSPDSQSFGLWRLPLWISPFWGCLHFVYQNIAIYCAWLLCFSLYLDLCFEYEWALHRRNTTKISWRCWAHRGTALTRRLTNSLLDPAVFSPKGTKRCWTQTQFSIRPGCF